MANPNKGLLVNGGVTTKTAAELRSLLRHPALHARDDGYGETRTSNGVAGKPVAPNRFMTGLSAQA